MKGGGVIRAAGGGAGGAGLLRTRLRLPVVLLSCSLFFLAGFFGSLLFTQDPEEADMPVPRERLLEAAWPEMPYGESGEAAPSLIPYQVMSHSDSISAWGGCLFRHTFGVTGIGVGTSVQCS
ncbi:putative prolyl 4-hydroxylase 9 [Zea mays]|uniref:Putative prolyl 4-hydroxylase 9 n=1 Tax=Zea mays TaxID=4577 RepID=A0A1D6L5N8_MAIZE|nr:putative prolyl 4-hydroxylase 9 [Zea mays]